MPSQQALSPAEGPSRMRAGQMGRLEEGSLAFGARGLEPPSREGTRRPRVPPLAFLLPPARHGASVTISTPGPRAQTPRPVRATLPALARSDHAALRQPLGARGLGVGPAARAHIGRASPTAPGLRGRSGVVGVASRYGTGTDAGGQAMGRWGSG